MEVLKESEALLIPRMAGFAMIGCGPTMGHQLINAGLLDARKLGNKTLITAASIKALVEGLPRAGKAISQPMAIEAKGGIN